MLQSTRSSSVYPPTLCVQTSGRVPENWTRTISGLWRWCNKIIILLEFMGEDGERVVGELLASRGAEENTTTVCTALRDPGATDTASPHWQNNSQQRAWLLSIILAFLYVSPREMGLCHLHGAGRPTSTWSCCFPSCQWGYHCLPQAADTTNINGIVCHHCSLPMSRAVELVVSLHQPDPERGCRRALLKGFSKHATEFRSITVLEERPRAVCIVLIS